MSIEVTTNYLVSIETKQECDNEDDYNTDAKLLSEAVQSVLENSFDPMQSDHAWTKLGLLDLDCEFTVSLNESNMLNCKIYISMTAEQKQPFNKASFKSALLSVLIDPKWQPLVVLKSQIPNSIVPNT